MKALTCTHLSVGPAILRTSKAHARRRVIISSALAELTFEAICCRFGLPARKITCTSAIVSSVTDYDQWDLALPHLCFGLNTHPSSATNTSPFELEHGFPARVPLTLDLTAHARLTGDRGAADYALVVHNRHRAAADNVAAAQVRLGPHT